MIGILSEVRLQKVPVVFCEDVSVRTYLYAG